MSEKIPRKQAVNAMCKSCIYDPKAGGTWLEQVAQCSVTRCPLWPVRPAPRNGEFANPPRDPANVSREWLKAEHGKAESRLG